MKTLHEHLNHDFARGLAKRFLGSEGTRIGGIYMMLAKKNKRGIFLKKGSYIVRLLVELANV
jgi:hypothetical protein